MTRRIAAITILGVAAAAAALPALSSGDLQGRIGTLAAGVQSDTSAIQQYQGRLADLRGQLAQLRGIVSVQRGLLDTLQADLRSERARYVKLRLQYTNGRATLAQELIAQYESPPPDVMDVITSARGFDDLLDKLNDMKLVAQGNAETIQEIAGERNAAQAEATKLAADEASQARVTASVLAQQEQVDAVRIDLLRREREATHSRTRANAELGHLERQLALEEQREAAAQGLSFSIEAPAGAGYNGSGFTPHGGLFGFFPAAGTNYTVNEEPQIAARLDALGRALHLHLIGISGYRTPEHSIEVGGFANDPHTKGEASDTPGIEGVGEAALEQFGLTRPFSAVREADHIQLLSWTLTQCGAPTCN